MSDPSGTPKRSNADVSNTDVSSASQASSSKVPKTDQSSSSSQTPSGQPTPPPPPFVELTDPILIDSNARLEWDTVKAGVQPLDGTYRIYTIVDGREKLGYGSFKFESGFAILTQKQPQLADKTIVVPDKITKISLFSGAHDFVRFIDRFKAMSVADHKIIKINPDFKTLYSVSNRQFNFKDGPKPEESAFCQYCAIALPTRLLQIDHTRPQQGASKCKDVLDEDKKAKDTTDTTVDPNTRAAIDDLQQYLTANRTEAVAKVFRMFGLTVAGPAGNKNNQLNKKYGLRLVACPTGDKKYGLPVDDATMANTPLGPTPTSIPKKVKAPTIPSAEAEATKARYTLNDRGTMIYSIFRNSGYIKFLQNRCMNSLANLRPLCSGCNGSRSNPSLTYLANWGEAFEERMDNESFKIRDNVMRAGIADLFAQWDNAKISEDERVILVDKWVGDFAAGRKVYEESLRTKK